MASIRAVVSRVAHFASGAPLDWYAERRSSLLACWRSLSLLAVTGFVFASGGLGPLTVGAQPARSSPVTISRPFPFVELQVGDVPLAVPKEWTTFLNVLRDKEGEVSSISFVNANLRPTPRTPYFEVPPLALFALVVPAPGLAARNVEQLRAEISRHWSARQTDPQGFWNWRNREFLLAQAGHARPLDQPLIVDCTRSARPNKTDEQRCSVRFYWTLAASVRYDFFDTDVPEAKWVELDGQVIKLLNFLDGRQLYSAPDSLSK